MELINQIGIGSVPLVLLTIYCLACWLIGWAFVSSSPSSIVLQPDEFFGFMIIVLAPIWFTVLLVLAVIDKYHWTPKRQAEEARWRRGELKTVAKKSKFSRSWFRFPVLA